MKSGIINGLKLAAAEKIAEAEQDLKDALPFDELSARQNARLSTLSLVERNPSDGSSVVDFLMEVVECAPTHAMAWLMLGRAYYHLNQSSDAIEAYGEASAIRPDWGAPFLLASEILYWNIRRVPTAIQMLSAYLGRDRDARSACILIGRICREVERGDIALPYLQILKKRLPDDEAVRGEFLRCEADAAKDKKPSPFFLQAEQRSQRFKDAIDLSAFQRILLSAALPGLRLVQAQKYEQAEAALREIMPYPTEEGRAFGPLGAALGSFKDTATNAVLTKWLSAVVKNNSKNHMAWFFLGQSFQHSHLIDDAFQAYSQAKDLKPDWAEPYFCLGQLYEKSFNDQGSALGMYKQAADQKPDFAGPPLFIFNMLKSLDRATEALPFLERLLVHRPKHPNGLDAYQCCKIMSVLGDKNLRKNAALWVGTEDDVDDEKEGVAFVCAEIDPLLCGLSLIEMNKPDKAIAALESVSWRKGGRAPQGSPLGSILDNITDQLSVDVISTFLEGITKESSKNYLAWLFTGRFLRRTGKYEDAIDAYRRVMKLRHKLAAPYAYIGEIYYKQLTHKDESIELFKKASDKEHDFLEPVIWLTELLLELDQGDEALPYLTRVREHHPDSISVQNAISRCELSISLNDENFELTESKIFQLSLDRKSMRKEPIREAFATHVRVVKALFLREVLTKFGRHKLGLLWSFIDPIIFIAILATVFNFFGRQESYGITVELLLVTGYVPWILFLNTRSSIARAAVINRSLLQFPDVTPFDAVVARSILELFIGISIFIVIVSGLAVMGQPIDIDQPVGVLVIILLVWLFAVGFGMAMGPLALKYPSIENMVNVVLRIIFFTSGIFFLANDLGHGVRIYFMLNPVMNMIDLLRDTFFKSYQSLDGSLSYIVATTAIVLLVGLMVDRVILRPMLFRQ